MLEALVVALIAGVAVAGWRLTRRLRDLEARVGEVRMLGRRIDALQASLERGLGVTRTHLAAVAAGGGPERATLPRGAPYQEIKPPAAPAVFERTTGRFLLDARTPGAVAHRP